MRNKQDCLNIAGDLSRYKVNIKEAIESNYVDVPESAKLSTYHTYIDDIVKDPKLQESKIVDIKSTGTFSIKPTFGYDACKSITLNIDIRSMCWAVWDGGGTATVNIGGTKYTDLKSPILKSTYGTTKMYSFSLEGNKSVTNVSYIDATYITSANKMFSGCSNLTKAYIFNTGKIKDMSYMFNNCGKLLEAPEMDTSSVTDVRYMFFNAGPRNKNTGDSDYLFVPNYDTSKCKIFSFAFAGAKIKNIPQWDFSSATHMSYTFLDCAAKTIPILNSASATRWKMTFIGARDLESIESVDFSGASQFEPIEPGFYGTTNYCSNSTYQLKEVRISGKIRYSTDINASNMLSYESVKSILTALAPVNNQTIKFDLSIEDRNGELTKLVNKATGNGWIIEGLNIIADVEPDPLELHVYTTFEVISDPSTDALEVDKALLYDRDTSTMSYFDITKGGGETIGGVYCPYSAVVKRRSETTDRTIIVHRWVPEWVEAVDFDKHGYVFVTKADGTMVPREDMGYVRSANGTRISWSFEL